jgi:hypothetical protein
LGNLIIRNGAKTRSLQTLFGRLNNKKWSKSNKSPQLCLREFGAFKPVSVFVLSFDNSFKTGFKTGYSLVLQKQIDSFKSVSFFS